MSRSSVRLWCAGALAVMAGACASEPPKPAAKPRPAPVAVAPRATRPKPPPDRSADVARELGVDADKLAWSPGRRAFAVALPPKDATASDAPSRLLVYGVSGDKRAELVAARAGEITDLHMMGDDRLVYLAPPPRPSRRKKPAHAKHVAPHPTYVVQPIASGATPAAWEGRSFVFSPVGDHLAYIAGDAGHEHVDVDGTQVYPRSGASRILGAPAWSLDGASLALIEGGSTLQLVVLVEFDNPNGDNTWPLPPQAADPSLHVFWAGTRNIVVGPELTKPVFATSFQRQ